MKQIILVRTDLKMSRGKIAAQVGHAAIFGTMISGFWNRAKWINDGQTKVILKIKNDIELYKLQKTLDDEKIKNKIIYDGGKTEVKPGTATCMVIELLSDEKINPITGKIPLLK